MPKAKIKRLYLIPILSKALDVIELFERNTPVDPRRCLSADKHLQDQRLSHSEDAGPPRLCCPGAERPVPSGLAAAAAALRLRGAKCRNAVLSGRGASVNAAAAAAGVELVTLDNRFDPDVAVRNAEEFVAKRVDLVLEFQVEEAVAPRVAHIFKKADIPLVAIDVPHPNATYFGVDNFEVGYEAGRLLAQHALRNWKGKADRVLGVGFTEAGSFVQSRITGAFDGIRERLPGLTAEQFLQIDGRGMREASRRRCLSFSAAHAGGTHARGRGN